ncbi:guanylate kinase [Strigomonas culicis]|uniref:guanylate kinase n=1 Tax=Strigomonas culicis TaxID=28005 RepID=S9WEU3_9TRYP|nr:guanylate kinase [Strigomonas culicis]|eukprot:EPY34250.1 guanylate kinase [Strigomonas culicis]
MSSQKVLNAIIVCGPSGVGKGTLLKRLFDNFGSRFAYSVSHTTRAPRAGEQDGREYHFAKREDVIKMRDNNEFLELCEVHGNFYGTSIAAVKAVQEANKTCVIEIDVQGAEKVKQLSAPTHGDATGIQAAYLFITAPQEELEKRIRGRGQDNDEMLQKRLATAEKEFAFLEAHPNFFDAVIVNDDLDASYGRLVDAISAEFVKHSIPPLYAARPTATRNAVHLNKIQIKKHNFYL